jgi:hypothetical protein
LGAGEKETRKRTAAGARLERHGSRAGRQIGRAVLEPTLDKAPNRDLDSVMGVFRNGMASGRGYIERLGPYQSLLILAVPTSLVEPFKLIAVAVAGEGHWITGTIMIIAAYGCSLLFVERLFRIVRPKLLTLPWFARLWTWVLFVRGKVIGIFRPG